MVVLLNGKFVPEKEARISVFDRGFLYGDGVFETVRVFNGQPFRWPQHLERFQLGARYLRIPIPLTSEKLRAFATRLIVRNRLPDCVLRLTLSRGVGTRGYSPPKATRPTVVMSLHPAAALRRSAPSWRLVTSSFRVPSNDSLARFKSSNKLTQVMARAEPEAAGTHESLLLNSQGLIVEGSASNLFWIERGSIFTPALGNGILPGVTRAVILGICAGLGLRIGEACATRRRLYSAAGVFLSRSSIGIAEAISLDGRPLRQSALTARMYKAYLELLRHECAGSSKRR